jgi:hypothetical protein
MFGRAVSTVLKQLSHHVLIVALAIAPAFAGNVLAPVQLPAVGQNLSYLDYFRYAEQRLNDKVENTDVFASIKKVDLEKEYRPEWETSFNLVSVLLPTDEVVIVQTNAERPYDLIAGLEGRSRVRFMIHPKSLPAFLPYLDSAVYESPLKATPLGSYRSVIAWKPDSDRPPFNLKVSLDVEIGGARRMLSKGQIQSAAITSLILKQGDPKRFTAAGINIIDEPYSVYLKNFEYGFTFRELPELPSGNTLIPLFSLYSIENENQKSLLSGIVRNSSQTPLNTLRDQLIRPLVRHFVFFAMTEGLVSEPHEQNVLVEMKEGQLTGRFFYRDLAGFNVNEDYRKHVGKDLSFIPDAYQSSIHRERTDLVRNFENYLINSNFFALAKSVGRKTSHEDVTAVAREIFFEEVGRYAGSTVHSMKDVRRVWLKPPLPNICSFLTSVPRFPPRSQGSFVP